jgi:DNA transformation protein
MEKLKNIGPSSEVWLEEVGITSKAALADIGPVMVYKMIQHRHPGVNRLLLYALQGAVMDVHWNALSPEMKAGLRREAEGTLSVEPTSS